MADSRVFSLPIVIRFDVLKNTGCGPAPRPVPFAVNEFDFQRMKKTLHGGVVIAGGSAAHATAQLGVFEQALIPL